MSALSQDPRAQVAGAMETTLSRRLDDGALIEFEQAPAGWLKSDGQPRKAPWRAYYFTPPEGGRRRRLTSVTTLLDDILPKDGLPRWSEEHGIKGAITAVREGHIDDAHDLDMCVEIVRRRKLGADAVKDAAAERGTGVHTPLEHYMRTGDAPRLADFPQAWRGYVTGLTNFLLKYQPTPRAVEQLVAHPEDGYAGRLDLRADLPDGRLATIDLKTQANAAIYPHAHYQVNLYERAAVRCGDDHADCLLVVVVAEDGSYRVMPADHGRLVVDAALIFRRTLLPIASACETANAREREARKPEAVAA